MKTTKLVTGILSIILFVFVSFQSCAAGLGNAIAENGEASGSAGLFVAIFLLAAGIVSFVSRRSVKTGGTVTCLVLYGLGALLGFTMAGSFGDLRIWGGWCLICAIIHLVSIFKKPIDE